MTEILFLIPYRLTRPYFASLYCECEHRIYSRHGEKYRLIWRCVTREKDELDGDAVVRILWREIRQGGRPGLLVVAPTMSRELTEGVAQVAGDLGIRVLALSLPFQFSEPFTRRNLGVPPVVHCDSAEGTRQLAAAAGRELNKRRPPPKNPRVVLVPGEQDRTDSVCRLDSFEAGLKAAGFDPDVRRLPACNWQRQLAYQAMTECIKQAESEIHVAFAANDEMALGVRDAIHEIDSPLANNCLVYGFDAVSEVCSLIKDNDRNMKGSVGQKIEDMAAALAEVIGAVLEPDPHAPPTDRLIPPECILPTPRRTVRPFNERVPDLPPFSLPSGEWMTAKDACKFVRLEPDTLKKYRNDRSRSEHFSWNGCEYGEDKDGRVWVKRPSGQIFYLRRSLTDGRPVSPADEGDCGGL